MKSFFIFIFTCCAIQLAAQNDSLQPPYKRFPSVPPFKLMLTDSSTIFSKADLKKKTPLWIIMFSPDCDHCKHETEELVKQIDKFKKVQIVMATTYPVREIKKFYEQYALNRFPQITMGRDHYFLLPPFFDMHSFPFLAFYDKQGKLISVFEGNLPVEKVAELFAKEQ